MWEIDAKSQILGFFGAIVLGFIFCLIYDLQRALRKQGKATDFRIFLEDLHFFIIISIITFIYYLAFTNGEIRFYILFGILIGFLMLHLTISKYALTVFDCVIRLVIKANKLFLKAFYWFFVKIDNIFVIMYKKTTNFFKKCLKTSRKMLYNNKS